MQVETLLVLDPGATHEAFFQFEHCVYRQGVPLDLGRGFAFDAVFQTSRELIEVLENTSRAALVIHVCARSAQFSAMLTALPRDRTRVLKFVGANPKPKQVQNAPAEELRADCVESTSTGARESFGSPSGNLSQNQSKSSNDPSGCDEPKNAQFLAEHTTRTGTHIYHLRLDPADRRLGLALAQLTRGEPPCVRSGLLRYLRERFQAKDIENVIGIADAGAELALGVDSAWTTLRALSGLRPYSRLPTAPAAASDDWMLADALSLQIDIYEKQRKEMHEKLQEVSQTRKDVMRSQILSYVAKLRAGEAGKRDGSLESEKSESLSSPPPSFINSRNYADAAASLDAIFDRPEGGAVLAGRAGLREQLRKTTQNLHKIEARQLNDKVAGRGAALAGTLAAITAQNEENRSSQVLASMRGSRARARELERARSISASLESLGLAAVQSSRGSLGLGGLRNAQSAQGGDEKQ